MDKHLAVILTSLSWYCTRRAEFANHVAQFGSMRHDGSEFTKEDMDKAFKEQHEADDAYAYVAKRIKEME